MQVSVYFWDHKFQYTSEISIILTILSDIVYKSKSVAVKFAESDSQTTLKYLHANYY